MIGTFPAKTSGDWKIFDCRAGATPGWIWTPPGTKSFQSTPPRFRCRPGNGRFNPRPRAGATSGAELALGETMFQSTPPRGGDAVNCDIRDDGVVSIHAPARGRPDHQCSLLTAICFNPRPRAGATSVTTSRTRQPLFQSTPPRGGDLYCRAELRPQSVSIHAPARGRRSANCRA